MARRSVVFEGELFAGLPGPSTAGNPRRGRRSRAAGWPDHRGLRSQQGVRAFAHESRGTRVVTEERESTPRIAEQIISLTA